MTTGLGGKRQTVCSFNYRNNWLYDMRILVGLSVILKLK